MASSEKRWYWGFRKVRNPAGRVAHLLFPGFVIGEPRLLAMSEAELSDLLLLGPMEEGIDVVAAQQLRTRRRV